MFLSRHCLLALSLGLGLMGAARGAEPSDALLTRSYDLSGIGPTTGLAHQEVMLLPFTIDHAEDSADVDLVEIINSLLLDVVAPEEMQFEGRSVRELENGRLLVVAPEAVHVRIDQLLDVLTAGFRREARVELSVARLDPDDVGTAQAMASLNDEPLETLAALRGPTWSTTLGLPLGQARRYRDEVLHQVVRGWESEIAQASVHAEPAHAELRTGLDLLLMAQGLDGERVLLRQLGRMGHIEQRDQRQVPLDGDVMLATGRNPVVTSGTVDDLAVSWASIASATTLSPGEVARQVLWTRTGSGQSAWLISLQLLAVETTPRLPVGSGREVRVIEASSTFLSAPEQAGEDDSNAPRDIVWPSRVELGRARWSSDTDVHVHRRLLGVVLDSEPVEELVSGLYEADGQAWVLGRWIVAAGPVAALDALQEGLSALAGSPRRMRLELGVDGDAPAGTTFGGPIARARLEMLAGESIFALVGDARSYVSVRDVDVAHSARATAAGLDDVFDGLLVLGEATRGGARIDVDLGRLLEIEAFSASGVFHGGKLDQITLHTSSASADLRADGERRVLGRYAAPDGSGSIELWARLTRD